MPCMVRSGTEISSFWCVCVLKTSIDLCFQREDCNIVCGTFFDCVKERLNLERTDQCQQRGGGRGEGGERDMRIKGARVACTFLRAPSASTREPGSHHCLRGGLAQPLPLPSAPTPGANHAAGLPSLYPSSTTSVLASFHEGAVGQARNHLEQLSVAEVWRRRGVDRAGDTGVSRMLGRELAGQKQDQRPAHRSMLKGSEETEKAAM